MSRWFRLYADAMRNPKVMRLSDSDFRLWVKLLSVASENDGKIPPVEDLKLVLSTRLDHLLSALKRLISGGLIDPLEHGYEPHSWNKFQYKSDTSNERVAKFRAKGNVTVTPPDTDTETEQKEDTSYEVSARAKKPDTFADFWAAYPRKTSRLAATKAYAAAIKRGVDPLVMLAAAEAYAAIPGRDPEFTKHPATWLNAGCYDDQPEEPRNDLSTGTAFGNRPMGRNGQRGQGGNVRANAAADLYAEAVERERREAEDSIEGGGDNWGTGVTLSALAH
jgi:hypothetical protein